MAYQDIELRAQRIVAERFLDRVKTYPEELQGPIKQAFGQKIAESMLDDILANDPVLRDEIAALESVEERLQEEYVPAEANYQHFLAEWFAKEKLLVNEVFVPLPGLPEDGQMPDEQDQVPIEIWRVHGYKGHDLAQYAWPQPEPPEHVDYDKIMEFRYVRACHRFLEVLREVKSLPKDPTDALNKLKRFDATGDLEDDEILKLFHGWYDTEFSSELGEWAFLPVLDETDGKCLLTDLAVAFPAHFATFAESL